MISVNPDMRISRTDDEDLQIETTGGTLRLSFVTMPDGREAIEFTPLKAFGLHFYRWDDEQETWVSIDDGHFLKELLTRELIFYCKGLPAW